MEKKKKTSKKGEKFSEIFEVEKDGKEKIVETHGFEEEKPDSKDQLKKEKKIFLGIILTMIGFVAFFAATYFISDSFNHFTVEGVKFIRTESVNGKLRNIPNSEFVIECDLVIKATGQLKQTSMLANISGLDFNETGQIIINQATCQTTNPIYFAGGDAVNGGAEVVNAAADGKAAGKGIHEFLSKLT